MGPGQPPAGRGQHARAARGLQRQPAQGDPLWQRAGPEPRPVRPVPGAGGIGRACRLRRGPAQGGGERAARLPPRWRRAGRRGEAAVLRGAGGAGRAVGEVLAERARRHRCVRPVRRRRSPPRRPAGGRGRRARGGGEGGKARLETDPADAVLPAGAGLCRRPRPARGAVPCQRRARFGDGPGRAGQQWPHRPDPRAARRTGHAARLRQLRRVFAGDQDGAVAGRGAGIPSGPGRACAAVRPPRPRRAGGVRARRARPRGTRALGIWATPARSSSRRATAIPSRR